MYQNRTDYELVLEFLAGNRSSLENLINRHRSKVYSYILFNVKDQHLAEDIFQDTFIKVIKSLKRGKYKDNGRFLSWVLRIAHNLVIDHYRKEKQLQTVSNDNYETDLFNSQQFSDKTIEDKMVNKQITNEIRNLIKQLPEDQREVVILRHYCELSFKEIAEYTDVSINTALGRMRYALINLRRFIEEKQLNLNLV
ncbi:MAG: sigma-70 family RNA polymerase sigma factor [Bacteroidales bacterium]|nr:sigma-70 family RNA polymerase sigma factor [Bacteroidales bacterium]MBN2818267.1 sigma-70 family RNA polymerase sigma factor [Bacteroidales bacterium]